MPISQLLRSAVSGMVTHKLNLDVIANNLANIGTTGYKASRLNFRDVLYQSHLMATTNRDLRVGAGVMPGSIQPAFTQGALQSTDLQTDMAIFGNGFFQVQLPDGTLAYTRNGNFHADAEGRLTTSDGHLVLPGVTIPEGGTSTLTVDQDGVVRIIPAGSDDTVDLGQIQLARFANPEGLDPIGQTLFVQTDVSGAAETGLPNTPGFGQVIGGTLEVSNVDTAQEMANLVMAQRAYGLSLKALQTIDEMVGLANNMRAR